MMMRTDEEKDARPDRCRLTERSSFRRSLVCECMCVLMCVLCIRKAHTNTHRQTDRQTLNDIEPT